MLLCARLFRQFVVHSKEDVNEFEFTVEGDEQPSAVHVYRQHTHDMAQLLGDADVDLTAPDA